MPVESPKAPSQAKKGVTSRLHAFSFVWSTMLAFATFGFAYFFISGVVLTWLLLAPAKDRLLAAIPENAALVIRAQTSQLSPQERQLLQILAPNSEKLEDANLAIVALPVNNELKTAVFIEGRRTATLFSDAADDWDEKYDILVVATEDTKAVLRKSPRLGDFQPQILAALHKLAGLSPIYGFIRSKKVVEPLTGLLTEGNDEPVGFALRKNDARTFGFMSPITEIAKSSSFLGLAMPQAHRTFTPPFISAVGPREILTIHGPAASLDVLTVLFDDVEAKSALYGSALQDDEAPELALEPFLGRPFALSVFAVNDATFVVARFPGLPVEKALTSVKNYLSRALPAQVEQTLPDGGTIKELRILPPEFMGNSNEIPQPSYFYGNSGIELEVSGSGDNETIIQVGNPSYPGRGIFFEDTYQQQSRLSPACQAFIGDSSFTTNLSTLLNKIYTQADFGSMKRLLSQKAVFTSVDNSVIFCE